MTIEINIEDVDEDGEGLLEGGTQPGIRGIQVVEVTNDLGRKGSIANVEGENRHSERTLAGKWAMPNDGSSPCNDPASDGG